MIKSIRDISSGISSGLGSGSTVSPSLCHSLASWAWAGGNFPLWVSFCPSLNEGVNRTDSGAPSSSTLYGEREICVENAEGWRIWVSWSKRPSSYILVSPPLSPNAKMGSCKEHT